MEGSLGSQNRSSREDVFDKSKIHNVFDFQSNEAVDIDDELRSNHIRLHPEQIEFPVFHSGLSRIDKDAFTLIQREKFGSVESPRHNIFDTDRSTGITAESSDFYASASELSSMFGPACPSMLPESLQENKSSSSRGELIASTDETKLVAVLQHILPFRKQSRMLDTQLDWVKGDNELLYLAGVISFWCVVTIFLGIWFATLHCISRKGARAFTSTFFDDDCNEAPPRHQRYGRHTSLDIENSRGMKSTIDEGEKSDCEKTSNSQERGNQALCDGGSKTEDALELMKTGINHDVVPPITWSLLMKFSSDTSSLSDVGNRKSENVNHDYSDDDENSEHGEQFDERETFKTIPILPTISDLSLPPGLSESVSSPGSSVFESPAKDDTSITALASDDIYTGNAVDFDRLANTENIGGTSAVPQTSESYLSYCLLETHRSNENHSLKTTTRNIIQTRRVKCNTDDESSLLISVSPASSPDTRDVTHHQREGDDSPLFKYRSFQAANTGAIGLNERMETIRKNGNGTKQLSAIGSQRLKYDANVRNDVGRNDYDRISCSSTTGPDTVGTESANRLDILSKKSVRMKMSHFRSDALIRKGRLEDFVKTWKESSIDDRNVRRKQLEEYIKLSQQKKKAANINRDEDVVLPQSNLVTTASSDFDNKEERTSSFLSRVDPFSPIRFPTEGKYGRSRELRRSPSTSRKSTASIPILSLAMSPTRTEIVSPLSTSTRYDSFSDKALSTLRCHVWILCTACVLLLASTTAFISLGPHRIHQSLHTLQRQWKDLEKAFSKVLLPSRTLIPNRLDQTTHLLYNLFNDHCPKVRSSLCSDLLATSTSCLLDELPLRNVWLDWLDASHHILIISESSKKDISFRHESFLMWLKTAREDVTAFFYHYDESMLKGLSCFEWMLWMASVSNIVLTVLVISCVARFLLQNDIIWEYTKLCPKERAERINVFGVKIFSMLFWTFVFSSWITGMGFSIAAVMAVDFCGGEEPNRVTSEILHRWADLMGTKEVLDVSIFDIVDHCLSMQPNIYIPDMATSIKALVNLTNPIQTLSDGLESFSSSGLYENICGHSILPLVQVANELNSQVCEEVEIITRTYLDLTSCNEAPWASAYNIMVTDTICRQGLEGLTWAVLMQLLIILFAFVAWSFRWIAIRIPEVLIASSETEEDPDSGCEVGFGGDDDDSQLLLDPIIEMK